MWSFRVLGLLAISSNVVVHARLQSACSKPKYGPGLTNITIESGGLNRTVTLYTPYVAISSDVLSAPSSPAPLVINWHGCNKHYPLTDYHMEISKVVDAARDRTSNLTPWYALVPLGTQAALGGDWGWNTVYHGIPCGQSGVNDEEFAEAILDFAATNLCVNTTRIYTAGFSTGAFLSYGIACKLGARIAGVGANSGLLARGALSDCQVAGPPVPVQSFHSLADPNVPYHGNDIWESRASVDAMWRARNQCTGASSEGPIVTYKSSTTQCLRWLCPGAPVETCTVGPDEKVPAGLDHCWIGGRSGGFPTCVPRHGDVDATVHMMRLWDHLAGVGTDHLSSGSLAV